MDQQAKNFLTDQPYVAKLVATLASTREQFTCRVCNKNFKITRQLAFTRVCAKCADVVLALFELSKP